MHGANDVGGPGNGDMGQAFDFDLDGNIDLLNGSEDGEWYLYVNQSHKQQISQQTEQGNYALVNVGYAPHSNIDAISAEVIIKTPLNEYRKRVGSAGAIFSQSLLNIVHFGLGSEQTIDSIIVRWRNGETVIMNNKTVNNLFDTDNIDPNTVAITPTKAKLRTGTSINLNAIISPINANKTIKWSSSDESVVTVNNQGIVTATGNINDTATITATSSVNGLSSEAKITLVNWFAIPVESISFPEKNKSLIAGQTLALSANILPQNVDNTGLLWSSSDTDLATISTNGTITAIKAGKVTIKAISKENNKLSDEIQITIKPWVEPYITIVNAETYRNTPLVIGNNITIEADYHAGTDNTVISADEGGIRFWLREFKNKWIPAKDIVLTDTSALKTEFGRASMTMSLDGLTPSSELPTGHFYYLNASFASSNGKMYKHEIYPITIIDANK